MVRAPPRTRVVGGQDWRDGLPTKRKRGGEEEGNGRDRTAMRRRSWPREGKQRMTHYNTSIIRLL
jgi:hypothetical protein